MKNKRNIYIKAGILSADGRPGIKCMHRKTVFSQEVTWVGETQDEDIYRKRLRVKPTHTPLNF